MFAEGENFLFSMQVSPMWHFKKRERFLCRKKRSLFFVMNIIPQAVCPAQIWSKEIRRRGGREVSIPQAVCPAQILYLGSLGIRGLKTWFAARNQF